MTDDKNLAIRSFKAASWVLILQFAIQFVQIFLGICMARLLTPNDYGVLGMLAIFWGVSNVFIQGGFGAALLQRKEVTPTDLSSVFYYNMLLSFICCFIMLWAAPMIANFYKQPILQKTIMVSAWMLPLGALGSVQQVILSRQLKQGFITASSLLSVLVSGGVALYLAKCGFGVWALVWQQFIMTGCRSLFVFMFVRWIPGLIFSFKALKSLFQFGSKLLVAGLLASIFENLNSVFIGKIYQSVTLGYYEQARRYSSLWPHSIQGSISKVLFPAFSKIQDDIPRLREAFRRALAVSVFTIIFPAYLLCTLSRPFIELVLTSKWIPCIPFWWLLTCTVVLWPIHVLNLELLKARGRSDLFLWLEVLKKCLSVISIIILIIFGLYPMLFFGVLSSCICAYINSYYVGKIIDYNLIQQICEIKIYILLSIISCFISWLIYAFVSIISLWGGFIMAIIMGGITYLITNRIMKTKAFIDLIGITGEINPIFYRIFRIKRNK